MYESLNRKKHQRKFNKVMRNLNKNIQNDKAWNGRFIVRQIHSSAYYFEDGSGMMMHYIVALIDKKTKKMRVEYIDESFSYRYKLWSAMNQFIVQDIGASCRDGLYGLDTTDYSKIDVKPLSYKQIRERYNWYSGMVFEID